jgi:hypothetical protein
MKAALLALALLALAAPAWAAKGNGKAASPPFGFAATPPPSSITVQGGGNTSGRYPYPDPRHPPPMDPKRQVNEQDCSKPIGFSAGNLRCK